MPDFTNSHETVGGTRTQSRKSFSPAKRPILKVADTELVIIAHFFFRKFQ